MIEVKPKKIQKKLKVDEFQEVKYRIDEMFLNSMKPILITSPTMILFYIIRLFMQVIFFYAAVYVVIWFYLISHRNPDKISLPFLAVYLTVFYCTFAQTIDLIKMVLGDLDRRKSYKKIEKEHLDHEKKLRALGVNIKKLKQKKLAHV